MNDSKYADRLYDLLWLLLLVLAVLLTLLLTGCTSTTECWYEGGKHICSTRFDG